MVTAKTQYSLRNAQGYFKEHLSVGDYYEEGQRVSGQWFGEGAQRLGLEGPVQSEAFLALCENENPGTGRRLTQRSRAVRQGEGRTFSNRRIFYDFTFSPPKSVSMVGLMGRDERVVEAHHRAVGVALGEWERYVATHGRRKGANDLRMTGNMVAALFTHDTSRALDPHLHTHCIVFNATFDPKEGRWQGLQNYEMFRARKYIENLYYHELAKDLRKYGYGIRNHPRGDFQIEGVSEELCERFSKRHKQVNAGLEKLLREKPELAHGNLKDLRESLAEAERSRKIHHLSGKDLRDLWDAQLSSEEKGHLKSLTQHPAAAVDEPEATVVAEALGWAEDHLFDRRSVVLEHELWLCALQRARGKSVNLEVLKRLTRKRGYLRDPKNPLQLTTRPVLQREWEIVAAAVNGVGQYQPFVEGLPKSSPSLDAEQQAALSHLLRSRDFITLFRGAAGTGKSYVLRELVSGLRDQGWSVTVLAPQRQQVVELEQAGFSGLTTLADFLIKRPPIRGGVVVVDEAGQIGARQMLDLIQHARSCGGRLILSGDTRQHGPVEASDALVALEHQAHLRPAQLETIKRQDPQLAATRQEQAFIAAYREAVQAAAVGRSRESFDRLDRMGVVVECGPGEQPDRLVREYLELTDKGYSTLIVSQTWSEVHRVNQQIRASLKEKGLIGNQEQRVAALDRVDLTAAQKRDARFYGPDSILLFNRKVRHGPAGATGRFVAALPEGVLVDAGQRVVTVPICHLDHITVCRPLEVTIAEGDRLQLKANRRLQGGSSVANGELVTVRQLRSDGHIELVDGRVLDPGYRQFAPGYAVTSYGSQGKTVDFVLFSDSAVKTATSDQQWYVTISRGRRGIRIFTPDKEQLRENVVCPGRRKLALEIASPLTARQRVLGRWFKRFGRRVSGPMLAARHACRFYRNRKETYEHQTARVLVT